MKSYLQFLSPVLFCSLTCTGVTFPGWAQAHTCTLCNLRLMSLTLVDETNGFIGLGHSHEQLSHCFSRMRNVLDRCIYIYMYVIYSLSIFMFVFMFIFMFIFILINPPWQHWLLGSDDRLGRFLHETLSSCCHGSLSPKTVASIPR